MLSWPYWMRTHFTTGCPTISVDTPVLILGKSPYKDQHLKKRFLSWNVSPYFEEIEERMANLVILQVCQRRNMYILLLK